MFLNANDVYTTVLNDGGKLVEPAHGVQCSNIESAKDGCLFALK